jgi:hypothetical protein
MRHYVSDKRTIQGATTMPNATVRANGKALPKKTKTPDASASLERATADLHRLTKPPGTMGN